MALKDRLLEAKSCMFVDDEDIEDMMAPFVTVVDRQGDKIKVEFWVEFYQKLAELHRAWQQRQVHRLDRRGAAGRLPPARRPVDQFDQVHVRPVGWQTEDQAGDAIVELQRLGLARPIF